MTEMLREAIDRYTQAHSGRGDGVVRTAIRGLYLVRSTQPGDLRHAIERPLICLVAQGAKAVTMGSRSLTFEAGQSMLLTLDAATTTQIVSASRSAPYLSFALDLNADVLAELASEMEAARSKDEDRTIHLQPTDAELADAALRLIRLLDRPASRPVLQAQLVRELHYWLLAGRHGPAIRETSAPDGRGRAIARAVAIIREEFASPLRAQRLASAAGMSLSAFYQHFAAATALSPLQFQKRLRLLHARRLMRATGLKPSVAAYEVGYASAPQFTRDYRRLFGKPPAQDTREARRQVQAA